VHYFYIEPEVAGGHGPNNVMDVSVHPPIVSHLHYEFADWLGDVLLESFPAFIVTEHAMNKLMESRVTGAHFAEAEVTTTYPFDEIHPGRQLPKFAWLQVTGRAGRDDFGLGADLRLVISERALDILKRLQLAHAVIELFEG
jgi:hypothetical protein